MPLPPTPRPSRPSARSPAAGGFLIAIGPLIGAGIGFAIGQATPGFLIGLASGVGMALAIWAIDRR